MQSPLPAATFAILNRSAVILLPAIVIAVCVVSVMAFEPTQHWSRAVFLAWDFGHHGPVLPVLALAGAMIGLCDWAFPTRRNLLFAAATVLCAIAAYIGYAIAGVILDL